MPSAAQNIVIREDATYETLSPNQQKFVDKFLETGDSHEAARFAGYKDGCGNNQATLKSKAKTLRRELACIIDDRVEHYARGAEFCLLGINTLKYLAQSSESETVRLNAAKEIVNKTLQAPVQRKEIVHNHRLSQMSTEDLDKRLEELKSQLYPKAKEVIEDGEFQELQPAEKAGNGEGAGAAPGGEERAGDV